MTSERYELASAAYPRLSQGEAEVVYKCLEPFGTSHSLDELVNEAKKRHLEALFKRRDSTTVMKCGHHHLRLFKEAGIVRVVSASG